MTGINGKIPGLITLVRMGCKPMLFFHMFLRQNFFQIVNRSDKFHKTGQKGYLMIKRSVDRI